MNLIRVHELFVPPIELLASAEGMSTRHSMAICHGVLFMEMIQDGVLEIFTPKGAREDDPQRLRLTAGGQKWYSGYLQGRLQSLKDENARQTAEQEDMEREAAKPKLVPFKKLAVGDRFKIGDGAIYRKLNDGEDGNAELLADLEHRLCLIPEDTQVLLVIS